MHAQYRIHHVHVRTATIIWYLKVYSTTELNMLPSPSFQRRYALAVSCKLFSTSVGEKSTCFLPLEEVEKLGRCSFLDMKQVWYFISKNQPGLWRSDPLRRAKLCWLATLKAPRVFSCSLLAFPLSVSLASSHLCCLCFSVSISKS